MLAMLLAVVTLQTFGASPERAALQAVYGLKEPPVVQRINVAGSYAAVLISGGMMEGSQVSAPILVQHFSFGWQALEVLNFRCRLESHGLSTQSETLLMRGMPEPKDERACGDEQKDVGPPPDVSAVRRLMQGQKLIPYVVVSRDWAIGEWYGSGGGQTLFQRQNGTWHLVHGVGGVMSYDYLRAHGVPYEDACKFDVHGSPCH
jgi:hypothetical protein